MSNRQSQQIDAANSKLEQIQGVISAAQSELRQLQADIKLDRRKHDLQISRLKKTYQQKSKKARKEFQTLSIDLQGRVIASQKAVKDAVTEKGLIEYEIGELSRKLERQRQEYDAAQKHDAEKLVKLKNNVERTIETLGAREADLTTANDRLEMVTDRLIHFEKLLVQAEEMYKQRTGELRNNLRVAESKLKQTERLIQEYETSLAVIREDDETRRLDLEKRENMLAAGKRTLSQQREDFDADKKRFYQTKSL